MSTTLAIESFNETNLRERTTLTGGAVEGAAVLTVASTQGFAPGDIIYVGELSREGCEKARIESVDDDTTISLIAPLGLAHSRFEPLVSVLGDLIHVYRAANIDGSVPALDAFTVLVTRDIDPDQLSTFYTDSSGNSGFWYGYTYFNASTNEETDLDGSVLVRGDDFGHYASLSEIRKEAGFDGAYNSSDTVIDQQRRAAEAEINTALSSAYTVPFQVVPEIIHTLTIQLAAGLLLNDAYRGTGRGDSKLKDARALIKSLQLGDQTIIGDDGTSIVSGEGISSWPDESAPRAFFMGDKF
jgi:phage gp36-like protein